MLGLYSGWISRWEAALAELDQNRVVRPFDWGLEWLGLAGEQDPLEAVAHYSEGSVRESEAYFNHGGLGEWRVEGTTVAFSSPVTSPYPENNTVYAEYFEAENHQGRAVLVIPQWNADAQSHLNLCRMLRRIGLSALRLSMAYHHRRTPHEEKRADYHVSANVGRTIHATRQSVLDARCCLDWLEQKGYSRIGILGTSLGSCVALLTAAHDARPKAAVFNHVSLHFADVVCTGVSCRHIQETLLPNVAQADLRRCWSAISPASFLGRLGDRDLASLLVWGNHDTTFRPEYSKLAMDAFRNGGLKHEVFRLPCGHYTTAKFPFSWMDGWAICRFLHKLL